MAAGALTVGGAPSYPVGMSPWSVAVADFDADANADLAVANTFSDDVSILRGNGDGTFATAVGYGAGDNPVSIAAGRLDGDADPDLAVTNSLEDTVSVLLGNGNSTFAAAVDYPVGNGPVSVMVRDLDSDGDADLAVANHGDDVPAPADPGATVSILLGNGDGTFAAAAEYSVGNVPVSVAIGNFDSDADNDLAVANFEDASVSILLGNGDGSFGEALDHPLGGFPFAVVIGDFDADAHVDLAVTGAATTILLGNGDGTFADAGTLPAAAGAISAATDDFDGDADLDLAFSNLGGNSVSVVLGNGDGTFGSAVDYPAGIGPVGLTIGRFDGNVSPDLAVANFDGDTVSILLGNGDGTFAVDADAPVVTIDLDPASPNGSNGWYVTDVTVTVSADDGAGSGVAETRCALDPGTAPTSFGDLPAGECSVTNVASDGLHTLHASSVDSAGNTSEVLTAGFKIDQTDPTVSCDVASPGPVFLLQGAGGNVSATVTDSASGLADGDTSSAATVGTVGNKTVSLTGEDNASNSTTVDCPYRVSYRFLGFQSPIPQSSFRRGSTIPVKFSLANAAGEPISDAAAQALVSPCRVKITLDDVEQVGCATYNEKGDSFQYDLKTSKSLAVGNHELAIQVSDPDGSGVVNTDGTTITIKA